MSELTPRMWQVFDAIKAGKLRHEIAEELGIGRSAVTNHMRKLVDCGLIRRRNDLPATARWDERYPWVVTEDEAHATYRLALPRDATLRLRYPQETERDVSVAPARVVRWQRWTVQGLLPQRPDGRAPWELLPEHRVVLIDLLDDHGVVWSTEFRASRSMHWRESQTQFIAWPMTPSPEFVRDMTLVIACAVGVESLMDLSAEAER
jgi:DNA-binding MarR family transcriptional regulator